MIQAIVQQGIKTVVNTVIKIHSQSVSSNWMLEDLRIRGIWSLPQPQNLH